MLTPNNGRARFNHSLQRPETFKIAKIFLCKEKQIFLCGDFGRHRDFIARTSRSNGLRQRQVCFGNKKILKKVPMSEISSETINWPAVLQDHRSWLTRVLQCRIGDRHAVEDALQEIALVVLRQIENNPPPNNPPTNDPPPNDSTEFDSLSSALDQSRTLPADPAKVAPWLYRVAVRQAVNFHRKSNRKSHPKTVAELAATSPQPQPLEWLVAAEQQQQFKRAFAGLTAAQREILTLKYAEKWSYQQLSDHLGIPVRSVEYRLLQARTELRKGLNCFEWE